MAIKWEDSCLKPILLCSKIHLRDSWWYLPITLWCLKDRNRDPIDQFSVIVTYLFSVWELAFCYLYSPKFSCSSLSLHEKFKYLWTSLEFVVVMRCPSAWCKVTLRLFSFAHWVQFYEQTQQHNTAAFLQPVELSWGIVFLWYVVSYIIKG